MNHFPISWQSSPWMVSLRAIVPCSRRASTISTLLQRPLFILFLSSFRYQTETHIFISLFAKNAQDVTLEFEGSEDGGSSRGISVTFHIPKAGAFAATSESGDAPTAPSSQESQYHFSNLSHPIVPSESSFTTLKTKIECKLKKEVVGLKWSALECDLDSVSAPSSSSDPSVPAPMMASMTTAAAVAHTYPSSSKKVGTDFVFYQTTLARISN